ncbi:MAG: nickel-dependent hydrogenase large subunit [Rhodospirillales bacterium]|nr:nickel-dependent hydrogenase large subunit [Rhodospirillales bacterium]
MTSAPPEGAIGAKLLVSGRRVARVTIEPRKMLRLGAILVGRPAGEALGTLPHLFSLCGTAQLQAGLEAVERACGLSLAPAQRGARRVLLLAETVLEHAQRLLIDWPPLVGLDPSLTEAKALRQALTGLRGLMGPEAPWARPGGVPLAIDHDALEARLGEALAILRRAVYGPRWEEGGDFGQWVNSQATLPARLLYVMGERGWSDLGKSEVAPMGEFAADELARRLEEDADGTYARSPDWQGQVYETGPIARLAVHPVIMGLRAKIGNGAALRLVARMIELTRRMRDLIAMAPGLDNDEPTSARLGSGSGLAMVEAARGRLAHRVELADGVVTRWQILAPTEWNFHPQGAFAKGVLGLEAGPDLETRARLIGTAIDPCVALEVAIEAADA